MKLNKTYSLALCLLALGLLATGCGKQTLYTWGEYQELLYESYSKPGSVSPLKEVERLEKDLQLAQSKNKLPHPGLHAQLGYAYYQLGKGQDAYAHFEMEKKLYPESSKMMDRLMGSLKKS